MSTEFQSHIKVSMSQFEWTFSLCDLLHSENKRNIAQKISSKRIKKSLRRNTISINKWKAQYVMINWATNKSWELLILYFSALAYFQKFAFKTRTFQQNDDLINLEWAENVTIS